MSGFILIFPAIAVLFSTFAGGYKNTAIAEKRKENPGLSLGQKPGSSQRQPDPKLMLMCLFSTPHMTGRRFHRTTEMIPALPCQSKSPSASTPIKQSTKPGNARGYTARNFLHSFSLSSTPSSSHIGHGFSCLNGRRGSFLAYTPLPSFPQNIHGGQKWGDGTGL